jgi:hypothetical protein
VTPTCTEPARIRVAPFRSIANPEAPPQLLRTRAEQHGYLFCPGLLPRLAVQELRDAVLTLARDSGWLDPGEPWQSGRAAPGIALGAYDDPRWIEFLRVMLSHPSFTALRVEPRLLAILEAILGAPPESDAGDILRVVSADRPEHTTVAHQDHFYLPGTSARWTAWVPLGDCPLSLGPLAVWPGSHARGLRPHEGPTNWQRAVQVPRRVVWAAQNFEAGDAIVFNWLTIHCALPNQAQVGGALRLSATYRYRAAGAT